MDRTDIGNIRQAVAAAQQAAFAANFDGCDLNDIEEIIEPVERELQKPRPNPQTLTTYLNSLARSLRAYAPARSVCLQLDAAMRSAGLTANWEH